MASTSLPPTTGPRRTASAGLSPLKRSPVGSSSSQVMAWPLEATIPAPEGRTHALHSNSASKYLSVQTGSPTGGMPLRQDSLSPFRGSGSTPPPPRSPGALLNNPYQIQARRSPTANGAALLAARASSPVRAPSASASRAGLGSASPSRRHQRSYSVSSPVDREAQQQSRAEQRARSRERLYPKPSGHTFSYLSSKSLSHSASQKAM